MNLLKFKTFLFLITLIFFSSGSALHAFAESAVQCHCFTNRSYNPADKFAADEYILATSFNSLLAKSFDIPKRQIVMIKMNEGVAQDDLLIGLEIAKVTGINIRKFLRLRKENNTWANIISGLAQQEKIKNDPLLEAIRSGIPVEEAGTRVADEIIAEFYQVKPEEISKVRMSGLNEKEMALLFILSHTSEIQPEALMDQYKIKGRSWSEIASSLGVEPAVAGKLILSYPSKQISD
jgi:hypothetical protein